MNASRRVGAWAVLLFVAGAPAFYAIYSHHSHLERSLVEKNDAILALERELAQIKPGNAGVREQGVPSNIAHAGAKVATGRMSTHADAEGMTCSNLLNEDAPAANRAEHVQQLIRERAQAMRTVDLLSSVSYEELQRTLSQDFDRETVDAQWAAEKENRLNAAIRESGPLSSKIVSVSCRSEQCKVSVLASGPDEIDSVMEQLHTSLNREGLHAGTSALILAAMDRSSGSIDILLTDQLVLARRIRLTH